MRRATRIRDPDPDLARSQPNQNQLALAHEEDGPGDGAAACLRLRCEGGEEGAEDVQLLLREGPASSARVRSREESCESLQREGAVAVVAWKPLPGGHGEAGAGGRRRGGLRVAHRGSRRRAGSATAN
jgi:hypothetical protein